MNDYVTQLAGAVQAVTFPSPIRYAWFGQPAPCLSPALRRILSPTAIRATLRDQLQAQLYRDFYCQGGARRPVPAGSPVPRPSATALARQFEAAHTEQGGWEPGWQRLGELAGLTVAGRAGMRLWLQPDDFRPDHRLGPAAPMVQIRLGTALPHIAPGFYMVLGEQALPSAAPLLRLYWNVTTQGAVRLLTLLTQQLNEAGFAFRLKVADDPAYFARCDTAVLYIQQQDYTAVMPILGQVYSALAGSVRPGIPALTKLLAPGLGLAEDPGNGESFGSHRCRLLADGLLQAYEAGAGSASAQMPIVLAHFAEAGVALDAPFRRPGSQEHYAFRLLVPVRQPALPTAPPPAPQLPATFGTMADRIGWRIAREAFWADDQCNWVGAVLPGVTNAQQRGGIARALGPDLYGGTSGIGLFLAELSAVTADPLIRRTAVGALRQALTHAARISPAERVAFYTGWVGLAFAAIRGGLLLQEESLIAGSRDLLQYLVADETATAHDLLSGRAGAIMGLLVLGQVLGEEHLRQFADQLGRELVTAADKSDRGYSWPIPGRKSRHNLTGFSHGAAGIGCALITLYSATRDDQYRWAGERAFAYEQEWFDANVGNWLDLRPEWAGTRRHPRPAFATYWCHGAPGIALARLRAYELLGTEQFAQEALWALQTTRQALQHALVTRSHDFSLCHGLAGNAQILLHAIQTLSPSAVDGTPAYEVAQYGITVYGGPRHPLPDGFGQDETPGLMLGWAGIGLFYLHLCHPEIPSVLLLQPDHHWT